MMVNSCAPPCHWTYSRRKLISFQVLVILNHQSQSVKPPTLLHFAMASIILPQLFNDSNHKVINRMSSCIEICCHWSIRVVTFNIGLVTIHMNMQQSFIFDNILYATSLTVDEIDDILGLACCSALYLKTHPMTALLNIVFGVIIWHVLQWGWRHWLLPLYTSSGGFNIAFINRSFKFLGQRYASNGGSDTACLHHIWCVQGWQMATENLVYVG